MTDVFFIRLETQLPVVLESENGNEVIVHLRQSNRGRCRLLLGGGSDGKRGRGEE